MAAESGDLFSVVDYDNLTVCLLNILWYLSVEEKIYQGVFKKNVRYISHYV